VSELLEAYSKVTDEFFNEMEKVRKEFKEVLKDEQLTKNAEDKVEASNREMEMIANKKEKKKDEKKKKELESTFEAVRKQNDKVKFYFLI
jgi:hypothetical protein